MLLCLPFHAAVICWLRHHALPSAVGSSAASERVTCWGNLPKERGLVGSPLSGPHLAVATSPCGGPVRSNTYCIAGVPPDVTAFGRNFGSEVWYSLHSVLWSALASDARRSTVYRAELPNPVWLPGFPLGLTRQTLASVKTLVHKGFSLFMLVRGLLAKV